MSAAEWKGRRDGGSFSSIEGAGRARQEQEEEEVGHHPEGEGMKTFTRKAF